MLTRARALVATVSASLALLTGCPSVPTSPGGPDTTPPEFLGVTVRLESTVQPTIRGDFDITTTDVVRQGINPEYTLRLIATAGDAESGIASITIESEITWQCQLGLHSEIIGVLQRAPLAFSTFTPPTTPVTPVQMNVFTAPLPQTGCSRNEPGWGPTNFGGFVRAVATNALGVVVRSRTFVFDYGHAGTLETPYMAECRANGVPIPPPWSVGTQKWTLHGNIRNNNLLQPGIDAEVWSYSDPNIRGACIALPRGSGGGRGNLAGIICQNADTGAACFWDSRWRDDANPMAQQPSIAWRTSTLVVARLKDATNLTEPDGGVCTDCHRGDNVFLTSPQDPAWESVLSGQLASAANSKFSTRVFSSSDNRGGHPRYVPLSLNRAGWINPAPPAPGCALACHENISVGFAAVPAPMPPVCATNGDVEECYR